MSDPLTPPFATKVAVVVRDDLEFWQRLNVTALLISGITAANPQNAADKVLKGTRLHA